MNLIIMKNKKNINKDKNWLKIIVENLIDFILMWK